MLQVDYAALSIVLGSGSSLQCHDYIVVIGTPPFSSEGGVRMFTKGLGLSFE